MSRPKSVWFAVRPYEPPAYAFTSINTAEWAADRVAGTGEFRPDVVRYDLADPERDKADAEALHRVAFIARTTRSPNEADHRAIERVHALVDRLKGGAR